MIPTDCPTVYANYAVVTGKGHTYMQITVLTCSDVLSTYCICDLIWENQYLFGTFVNILFYTLTEVLGVHLSCVKISA